MKINILTSNMRFCKIVNEKEIDVDARDLKLGDIFVAYNEISKTKKCHWYSITTLLAFQNDENVEFITCEVVI